MVRCTVAVAATDAVEIIGTGGCIGGAEYCQVDRRVMFSQSRQVRDSDDKANRLATGDTEREGSVTHRTLHSNESIEAE